ncbi:MAG: hypothetical protein RL662_1161 [Bacteroidota bacterium]|jgi:long-chain acyl-CoA synthetase
MTNDTFFSLLKKSFRDNWELPALSDSDEYAYSYKSLAQKIRETHSLFQVLGIRKGDKVAICGRNSPNWAAAFFASVSYGAVATPILSDFTPEMVENIVNHSDAKLLFAADHILSGLDFTKMDTQLSAIKIDDFSLVHTPSASNFSAYKEAREQFALKYKDGFSFSDMYFHDEQPNEMAVLNYTSGTTSSPKGVMIPYRSLWSNIEAAMKIVTSVKSGDCIVSNLPMGHMFGLGFELIFGICSGCRVHFLSKLPSPQYLLSTFATFKPPIVCAVPLVLEKIVKNMVMPALKGEVPQTEAGKKMVKDKMMAIFGGNLKQVYIAGAALSKEVGEFLTHIDFPYTVGYGMTECATLITLVDNQIFKTGCCGKMVDRMEIRIESEDPRTIAGELLTRGTNVMLGYYKNPEATEAVLSPDGWLRTGDLALVDDEGFYYLKGRSKTMILAASGQNIYPEEIEELFNGLPHVIESLIIEKGNKLVALVYPDMDFITINNIKERIQGFVEEMKDAINKRLPSYIHISEIMLRFEEFEKTPKRSIRRFLYQ